jgi:S-adenosylmethionine-diacylgycerolhomoserine-N-methlytransferase
VTKIRAMSLLSDLRVIYHMVAKPIHGTDHASRLESFYSGQAQAYDDFRRRLLQGREEMYRSIPVLECGTWVDLGGGTGANLEPIGSQLHKARKVYLVDLCDSLLAVARKRCDARGWKNVEAVAADATTFQPGDGPADVVTFSYSLTMIPDWFAAIDNAWSMLRPGGTIGVTDFYVARKYPADGNGRHSWPARTFWSIWFGADNVFVSPDHLPYLQRRFSTVRLEEKRARLPYMPLVRAPYYTFIGRKAG